MPLTINLFCQPTPCMSLILANQDAPVAAYDAGTATLSWTYAGSDVLDHWLVENSTDGGVSWAFAADVALAVFSMLVDPGTGQWRVTGVDGAEAPVTQPSNAVAT